MRRRRIMATAVLLALAGIAAPLAVAWHWSGARAENAERQRLQQLAGYALARAQRTFDSAGQVLRQANALQMAPCAPAHLQRLRELTITTRSVDDIGYVQDGQLRCAASGTQTAGIGITPSQFTRADGVGVDVALHPQVSGGKRMVGLALGSYKVLVEPVRFADLVVEPGIAMAMLLDNGAVLGTLNQPDMTQVQTLLAGARHDGLHAVLRQGGLTAVVLEPRSALEQRLQRELVVWLPMGALMAAFLVAVVVWLSRRRLSLRGELAIAVERREFFVHYQPLVELASGRCVGAEALVRWRRPDGSMVRPDLFVPVLEESGLILPMTDQLIARVVHEMGGALVADRTLHIAINLCASDIETGRALDVLERALAGTGIEPQQIWLEATERGFINVEAARATLERARARGHAVAIDDFGTGYSSLASLQSLPLDALKIDKAFVDTIGMDAATSSVTPHIIDMARTLGLHIVAEGIETQQQADYLRARQVEFGQGWLFAKALPPHEFLAFYRARLTAN